MTILENTAWAVSQTQLPPRSGPSTAEAEVALRQHATPVRARRRQRLTLDHASDDVVYIVRSGMLGVEALMPGKHRQLLALYYPGDIIRRSLVPDLQGLTLTALSVTEVWRLPARSFDALIAANPDQGALALRRLSEQLARSMLHTSIIGTLNGDERFASFLVELGLRLGHHSTAGVSLEVPLTRTDMADYLALNPDTLSRITSRFKARGLLRNARSGHTVLPTWEALCSASPVAATLLSLHTPHA